MQLYAVNFIPLLSSHYMFRAAHTPIIRSTTVSTATGTIIGWRRLSRLLVPKDARRRLALGTSSRDNLRQPMILPVAVDTVELCTPDDGHVCRPKHVEWLSRGIKFTASVGYFNRRTVLINNCASGPPHIHIAPAKTEVFVIWWDIVFYSLLIEARVLCYQLLYHNFFHLTIFKFMSAKNSFQRWEELTIAWQRNLLI